MRQYFFIILIIFVIVSSLFPQSIPDFFLKRIDGSQFKFSECLGKKIIIIEFWATWCKPCKKFLKKLNDIYLDYKDKVNVIAISVDDSSTISKVNSYIKGKGFSFLVLLDPDSNVSKILNPSFKIPFTIIIDKKGNIRFTHTGYMPGVEKEIRKKLKRLLVD